jgi:hypothetical protein
MIFLFIQSNIIWSWSIFNMFLASSEKTQKHSSNNEFNNISFCRVNLYHTYLFNAEFVKFFMRQSGRIPRSQHWKGSSTCLEPLELSMLEQIANFFAHLSWTKHVFFCVFCDETLSSFLFLLLWTLAVLQTWIVLWSF